MINQKALPFIPIEFLHLQINLIFIIDNIDESISVDTPFANNISSTDDIFPNNEIPVPILSIPLLRTLHSST